jgi:hypothetical protein
MLRLSRLQRSAACVPKFCAALQKSMRERRFKMLRIKEQSALAHLASGRTS